MAAQAQQQQQQSSQQGGSSSMQKTIDKNSTFLTETSHEPGSTLSKTLSKSRSLSSLGHYRSSGAMVVAPPRKRFPLGQVKIHHAKSAKLLRAQGLLEPPPGYTRQIQSSRSGFLFGVRKNGKTHTRTVATTDAGLGPNPYQKKKKMPGASFDRSSRFGGLGTNENPGPKYSRDDNPEQQGTAVGFGSGNSKTSDRSGFVFSTVHNGMCMPRAMKTESDIGPAKYDVTDSFKRTRSRTPGCVWGQQRGQRFRKKDHETDAPGPIYSPKYNDTSTKVGMGHAPAPSYKRLNAFNSTSASFASTASSSSSVGSVYSPTDRTSFLDGAICDGVYLPGPKQGDDVGPNQYGPTTDQTTLAQHPQACSVASKGPRFADKVYTGKGSLYPGKDSPGPNKMVPSKSFKSRRKLPTAWNWVP